MEQTQRLSTTGSRVVVEQPVPQSAGIITAIYDVTSLIHEPVPVLSAEIEVDSSENNGEGITASSADANNQAASPGLNHPAEEEIEMFRRWMAERNQSQVVQAAAIPVADGIAQSLASETRAPALDALPAPATVSMPSVMQGARNISFEGGTTGRGAITAVASNQYLVRRLGVPGESFPELPQFESIPAASPSLLAGADSVKFIDVDIKSGALSAIAGNQIIFD